VPSKKRRHSSTYSDDILLTITKNNNILELQNFFKCNDFAKKIAKILKITMLEDLIRINQ
jgi:hypothetical protein